ncbi:MAG: carbonate dehydratase [Verrucomicrobia bacterium]|nr:carbonate dehydratase [Verrucomicrobiota bacterium]
MKELKALFAKNQDWVASKLGVDTEYFMRMAQAQDPLYLWIGCADSRVPANEIVGLEPGELFVHRNVANLFPHTDFNCLSVLEYAIDLLKIKHVIVCGHYGCGGVQAAMEDHQLGLVDNWLRNIRDVYAKHKEELDAISDKKARHNRLVELNVLQQVLNVCHTTIAQGAWHRSQPLCVHGWVYDMETGKLKDMDCCLSSIDQVEKIYRIRNSK